MISSYNLSTYSRFNLSESESDINVFVKEYREHVKRQLVQEEEREKTPFVSFAAKRLSITEIAWLKDNKNKFLKDTKNEELVKLDYLSICGFIFCMAYSPDGEFIIVGHSSGLIQMRHGSTGTVLCTLRNIQFPPKPIYAIEFSTFEERVCYAACMDGAVYRIEIPNICPSVEDPPAYCIKADPALESLSLQFYGSPGISSYATSFVSQRSPALSLGLSFGQTKMIVGYEDTSIKVYDIETQETEVTYKVHKLRLQFVPKKLQRMHSGQVCALRCHKQRPYMFASAAWDKTLRIWDVRCKVGCVMTFEGVDICSDSIDLNRDQCIAGSWQPTEALTLWDLTAKKKLHIVRVQNRRYDVDGEYVYACRYWNSSDFNRKGKYGIVGGSGTNCVEVINLHNRYITCSYPAAGTVLAVASHQKRIVYGGTAPVFTVVKFHDPKHEKDKYERESEPECEYSQGGITIYRDDNDSTTSSIHLSDVEQTTQSEEAVESLNILN